MNTQPSHALPSEFLRRLEQIVAPDGLAGVLASYGTAKLTTFRVNPLRAADSDVLAELARVGIEPEPIAGLAHVYCASADARHTLVRSAATTAGRLYIQSISSLLAAPALDVAPGMTVLDLAAAPGGKTLHLAALMSDTGRLSAVESSRPRVFRLRNNLRIHGVTCCRVYHKDGRSVGRLTPNRFDRVLLDAPCSGEAQLGRAGADDTPNWSVRKIQQCAGKQRALLRSAIQACRPGGLVLYCTCTFAPEENELVIADILTEFADAIALEPVPLPPAATAATTAPLTTWKTQTIPTQLATARRILPDNSFDAFFLCRLRKSSDLD